MSRVVAVTGATGFIGRHLTSALVERGVSVRAVIRPESSQTPPERAVTVRAALDAPALTAAFKGADTIVHLAGLVSAVDPAAYRRVNAGGTRAVAQAAAAVGATLVYVSSLAAAGPAPLATPRSEDDPPAPITPYGVSKLEGERAVMETPGLRWTILRPGVVYGPGDRALLPLFQYARRGLLPVVGNVNAAYTFGFVSDVVRAIDAALESSEDGLVLFVGHPRPVAGRALLEGIRDAIGRKALFLRVPNLITRIAAIGGDVIGQGLGRRLVLDRARYLELRSEGFVCRVDRLQERLGVVATVDLAEGLARTAESYRREGWIRP